MNAKVTTNAQQFEDMLDRYAELRGQEHVDVVNRMAYFILLRVVKRVPKADLKAYPLRPEDKPGKTTYRQHGKKSRLYYKIAVKNGAKRGENGELTKAAQEYYNKRRKAKGAIAAGFVKCLRAFDGQWINGRIAASTTAKYLQPRPGASAARSTASRAQRGRLKGTSQLIRAFAINEVLGSGEVAPAVVDAAIAREVADKQRYINRKIQQLNNQVERGSK